MAGPTGDKLLDDAIAGTEKEIFGGAFGDDGNVNHDDAPDTSLEEMEDDISSDTEGDEDGAAGDGEAGDQEGNDKDAAKDAGTDAGKEKLDAENRDKATGQFKPKGDGEQRDGKPQKGDPTIPLRAERQRAAALQADLEKERSERAAERESFKTEFAKIEGRLDQIMRGQQAAPKADAKSEATVDAEPDMFVDPEGWKTWNRRQTETRITAVQQNFEKQRVESSLADAADQHGEAFEAAYGALTKLNPQNPAHQAIVNAIRAAPNPGKELMRWHKRQEALREVGDDPTAYRQKVASELLKDPEFRKQLLADMRAEAGGDGGERQPQRGTIRNVIRTPRSLNSDGGRAERTNDNDNLDDSEAAVFAAAWK